MSGAFFWRKKKATRRTNFNRVRCNRDAASVGWRQLPSFRSLRMVIGQYSDDVLNLLDAYVERTAH